MKPKKINPGLEKKTIRQMSKKEFIGKTCSELRKMPIFPDYEITEYTDYDPNTKVYKKGFDFNSIIRIKSSDGKYYLARSQDRIRFEVEHEWQSTTRLHMFLRKNIIDCYRYIFCSSIIADAKYLDGEDIFVLDEDQSSEEERLHNVYPH